MEDPPKNTGILIVGFIMNEDQLYRVLKNDFIKEDVPYLLDNDYILANVGKTLRRINHLLPIPIWGVYTVLKTFKYNHTEHRIGSEFDE